MFYVHYIVFSFVLIFASVVDNMNGSIRVQCSRGPKQEQFVWFSLTSDQTKILMQFILTLPNPLILYGYIYNLIRCYNTVCADILYVYRFGFPRAVASTARPSLSRVPCGGNSPV